MEAAEVRCGTLEAAEVRCRTMEAAELGVHNSGGCRDVAQDQIQIRWTEEQTDRN